jgi:hypothetical protein
MRNDWPVADRLHLRFMALAALCLTGAAAPLTQMESRPSADDFLRAMEAQFSRANGNTPGVLYGDCWHVKQLQCSAAHQGRSTCTYIYSRHDRPSLQGTAILERNADASWTWVSGPLQCEMGVLG